ncbi:Heat shock protein 70 (Hsp 70) family protein isoform 2 [Hibiscus syriacus]|uniref:Heat shock protein 70 (Hsp 70) family protein isoform 2 n=1 Tax=Hibiscus syriacus TaxID=106335 RepID=A0A6A2Y6H3_HIBSY|nr:Heat shock protein 70 (Hsp 70) family protein isoform 2 [Hibiscus syriacus]
MKWKYLNIATYYKAINFTEVKLQEYFGRKDLDKHLDADEAIVLGAALHAANLSDGIKWNRKLGMIDGSSYSFFHGIRWARSFKTWGGATMLLVVPRMKKLPSKIFKFFNHRKDFEVSLAYDHEDLLPSGLSSPVFAQYSSRNLSSPIKTNVHFSLSRSGILSFNRAEAVFQVTEWVEISKRNLTVENSTSASPDVSADLVDLGTEKKLKKMTFRIPLKIVQITMGPGIPLSKESLLNAKSKLDKKDAVRRRTAELKNNLEEYIYSTKEKLETSEDFERISSNDERQSVIEKLDEVQETATEFQERLNLLKASTDPIFFRTSGFSTPVSTSKEVYEKIIGIKEKADSIKKIPKPKPKDEKPVNNKTNTDSENSKTPDSTLETDTSQTEDSEAKVESELHEEL